MGKYSVIVKKNGEIITTEQTKKVISSENSTLFNFTGIKDKDLMVIRENVVTDENNKLVFDEGSSKPRTKWSKEKEPFVYEEDSVIGDKDLWIRFSSYSELVSLAYKGKKPLYESNYYNDIIKKIDNSLYATLGYYHKFYCFDYKGDRYEVIYGDIPEVLPCSPRKFKHNYKCLYKRNCATLGKNEKNNLKFVLKWLESKNNVTIVDKEAYEFWQMVKI